MIQIDIPMPDACDVCPFNYDFCWCRAFEYYDDWEKYSDDWNENVCERTTRPEYCPLKEQEAQVQQFLLSIADSQLAHAPNDSHEFMSLDEHLENEYKRGIWDGLQIAWNIISEGR